MAQTQFATGYNLISGFHNITDTPPMGKTQKMLNAQWIDTPLGQMIVLCDKAHLYLMEFTDRRGLKKEIQRLCAYEKINITQGRTDITTQIETELKAYFAGNLNCFKTPIKMVGSEFQKTVWNALLNIPCGRTLSYKELAIQVGKPTGARAVANAVGSNQHAIVIPCHRIIGHDGSLTGYAGGLPRKEFLLTHENALK